MFLFYFLQLSAKIERERIPIITVHPHNYYVSRYSPTPPPPPLYLLPPPPAIPLLHPTVPSARPPAMPPRHQTPPRPEPPNSHPTTH